MEKTKLKRAIKRAGNAKKLAELLGVSKQYISQVTNYYGLTGTKDSPRRPLSEKYWLLVDEMLAK